jgi:hygromycin-B 4-O-kinase
VAKPSFRSEIVRKKVDSLFPDVSAFEPILGGQDSQAFRFASEGRKFILRLNADAEVFEKDRFVFERFAKRILPIPEVVLIGQVEDHFYCVSKAMPGRTLEDLPPDQIAGLLVPTCQVWQAIAQSDLAGMSGYGPFDSKGITTFSTWRDFLVGILDTAEDHWETAGKYTNTGVLQDWAGTLRRLAASCPEERALVHGDFGSNNVLADGEHISAVLDWSEAMIGDPLYDVANIFFWRSWLPCMEQQARYFEAHPFNVRGWQQRLLCYQLRIGISEVLGSSFDRRSEAGTWALARCAQIIGAINCYIGGSS